MKSNYVQPDINSFEAYADIYLKNIGAKLQRKRIRKGVKFEHILQSTGIRFESVKLIEQGKDVNISTFLKYKLFIENQ